LVLATSGLRTVTAAGDVLTFHVAPWFGPDAVDLAVLNGDNGAGPPSARPTVGGRTMVFAGASTNIVAEFPYGFANQILRQLTATRPLAIPVDPDVMDLQNVSLAAAPNGLMVTGFVTPRSVHETARLTVLAGGDEARVASVRSEAQLENCAGLGTLAAMACNARNAGRGAAAAGLSAALTQKFQGQLLRDLAGPQAWRFDVGGDRRDRGHWIEIQGALQHVTPGGRGVSLGGRFAGTGGAAH
jgi:hypothetical protein